MKVTQTHQHIPILFYLSAVIAGLALILNIIGIPLIRVQPSQRTHQNLIILHLSILQIPISISALAYWISILIHGLGPNAIMNWSFPLVISSRTTVVLIISILTADRLIAIKYSLRYMTIASKRKVMVALIASWLPWVLGFSILASLRRETYEHALVIYVIPVLGCILLVFILYTYSYIYWRIRRRRRILKDTSASSYQTQDGNKQILRVSTAIIVSYLLFVVLPDLINSMIGQVVESESLEIIMFVANMLNTCYYLTLPIIYIFLHKEMRRMFMEAIVKCFSRSDVRNRNVNVVAFKEERMQDKAL